MTDTEFSQAVNPQSFCTGVSLHHPALIQNTGPLIDMSDIRPGTSKWLWSCGAGLGLLASVGCLQTRAPGRCGRAGHSPQGHHSRSLHIPFQRGAPAAPQQGAGVQALSLAVPKSSCG